MLEQTAGWDSLLRSPDWYLGILGKYTLHSLPCDTGETAVDWQVVNKVGKKPESGEMTKVLRFEKNESFSWDKYVMYRIC